MSEFITHSREETVALGAQVAQHLAPGALIAFTGESETPREVAQMVRDEIARLRQNGVDPELFTLVKNQMYGEMLADVENVDDAAEEMGMAFLKGRTLADEIEALAALTVDDVNKALQTMLLEENSAYIQIDPKE